MRPGDLLAGKYRVDATIGEGAMGVVWRATQLDLERPVAIKLLHANLAARPDSRARFVREARVAATLHHPNAVRILDFGEAPAGLFLVMELLVGTTLRDHLDLGVPERAEALAIGAQIAHVLAAAHRVNLVHRDIKPENTFLETDADGLRVRVVDFGLAFIADSQGPMGRLTDEGILGGTPAYMSPEQARGKAVGPASDVYSLGCTLYELLAGRPPFLGTVAELITRHAYTPPLALHELDLEPAVARELDELVLSMLSKSPPLRPSASQVADALDAMAAPTAAAAGPLRLHARSTRMVTRPPDPGAEADEPAAIAVRIEGAVGDEFRLGLAAAGVRVLGADDPGAGAAVFAPGASIARLIELAAGPAPVITDVDAGDFEGMAARVRAGCRDAVVRPARAEILVRKLRRLGRAAERTGGWGAA